MLFVQYWNLSGNCVRDILGHRLQIFSSKIQKSPIDSAQLVPTWYVHDSTAAARKCCTSRVITAR